MKRVIISLIILSLTISAFCIPTSAAIPGWIYDFTDEDVFWDEYYDSTKPHSGDCILSYDDDEGCIKVETPANSGPDTGRPDAYGDPYFEVRANRDGENLDAETYQWGVLTVKNPSDAVCFQFHFDYGSADGLQWESSSLVDIEPNCDEYKTYVFNVVEANEKGILEDVLDSDGTLTMKSSVWTGEVSSIRLDAIWVCEPCGQAPSGSVMYIKTLAFFNTEADAKAFANGGEEDEETTVSDTVASTDDSSATTNDSAATTATVDTTDESSAETNANTSGDDSSSSTLYIILGVVAAVLVVTIIVVGVLSKKKKK